MISWQSWKALLIPSVWTRINNSNLPYTNKPWLTSYHQGLLPLNLQLTVWEAKKDLHYLSDIFHVLKILRKTLKNKNEIKNSFPDLYSSDPSVIWLPFSSFELDLSQLSWPFVVSFAYTNGEINLSEHKAMLRSPSMLIIQDFLYHWWKKAFWGHVSFVLHTASWCANACILDICIHLVE